MMRSLYSGVAGLRNHQVRMDVIGNNIANVNTAGFKAGRVTFTEGFAQTLQSATRPMDGRGGSNPMQVGLGMNTGSIDILLGQGSLETTGRGLDLAIQGDSFFTVARGGQQLYTRAGNFSVDASGRLVTPTGDRVQGRMADATGRLTGALGDLTIPLDSQSPAAPTAVARLAGNLDASAASAADGEPDEVTTSIVVYDSLGSKHELKVVMTRMDPTTNPNEWSWQIDESSLAAIDGDADPAVGKVEYGTTDSGAWATTNASTFRFDADGRLILTADGDNQPIVPQIRFQPENGAEAVEIRLDLGTMQDPALTQFAGASSAVLREQDGYPAGSLEGFEVDGTGTITGFYSNGNTTTLGQIALAEFANPGGLMRLDGGVFTTSPNSGSAVIEYANGSGDTSITSGALEMSNVDLAREFTDMIVAQRGFQANGRVITSTDEMLQEVVNLKR